MFSTIHCLLFLTTPSRISKTRDAVFSHGKSCDLFIELILMVDSMVTSFIVAKSALAMAVGSVGSKYLAASPQISGMGSLFEASMGAPQDMASTTVIPKDSHVDGYTNNVQPAYR